MRAHFALEVPLSNPHFSIEAPSRGAPSSFERRALFQRMIEQSEPISRDLLGARALLIVDDEAPVLRSMVRLLKQAAPELELISSESASDGIARAGLARPDAILLDAYMPETHGVHVCSRIHSTPATSHIPILAMTADPTPELASAFQRAGAVALLEKPVVLAELFEILSTHLLPSAAGDS